jgi:phosphoglucosamine mutase
LTTALKAGAGIVLSASHNPHEYNGFKLFSHDGYKLSEKEEEEIEGYILSEGEADENIIPGNVKLLSNAVEEYTSFLEKCLPQGINFKGLKIVLDCANGATFKVAPLAFKKLGLEAEIMFFEPDGTNINRNCGSQYTESVAKRVVEIGADVGLAFDGDGDRLISVDEKGQTLTGDQLMTIFAKMLKEKGGLQNNIVVSTVMSNIGLKSALKEFGVKHVAAGVGDRFVMEEMKRRKGTLGGEDSGHIIFFKHHTTGDGVIAGLQLLYALKYFNKPLSALSSLMTVFPQRIINVPVKNKPEIFSIPEIVEVIKEVENDLAEDGRVLVRYSGTEPLCRVMVEGKSEEEIEQFTQKIADVITEKLNP